MKQNDLLLDEVVYGELHYRQLMATPGILSRMIQIIPNQHSTALVEFYSIIRTSSLQHDTIGWNKKSGWMNVKKMFLLSFRPSSCIAFFYLHRKPSCQENILINYSFIVQEYLSDTSCYITDRNEDGEIWDLNRMSGTNNPPYHCSVYLESSNENALSRINSWQTCPSVYESFDHQGCPVAINPERSPGFYNNNNCDSTPPTMNYDIRTMLGSGIFFA